MPADSNCSFLDQGCFTATLEPSFVNTWIGCATAYLVRRRWFCAGTESVRRAAGGFRGCSNGILLTSGNRVCTLQANVCIRLQSHATRCFVTRRFVMQ